jgi:hypothetical protein
MLASKECTGIADMPPAQMGETETASNDKLAPAAQFCIDIQQEQPAPMQTKPVIKPNLGRIS